jgi:ABC-type bacteriocin/lantibiotic exporter with double-glycine peptidase domain
MTPSKVSIFKRFSDLLKPDTSEIRNIYLFAILSGVLSLGLPLGIQMIITFIQMGQVSASWMILVLLVTLAIGFSGVLTIYQMRITENLQQRIFTRSTFEFAARIPQMKLLETLRLNAGDLTNRFFDTVTLQKGISKLMIDFTSATLQILFGLILLSFYHSFFIFLGILLVLMLFLIVRLTGKEGYETSLKESSHKYKIASWLSNVSNAKISFKMSAQHGYNTEKANGFLLKYLGARNDHFKVLVKQYTFLIIFKIIIALALLIVGGLLVINQELNIGQFVASEIIILLVLSSVEKLIISLDIIYDVFTSTEKIGQVTDIPLESYQGTALNETSKDGISIQVNGLNFQSPFYAQNGLNAVTFTIQQSERVCIVSDSSTTVNALFYLLTGICEKQSGVISFDQIPYENLDKQLLRNQIGTVTACDQLIDVSIEDNIRFGKPSVELAQIVSITDELGLTDFINQCNERFTTKLSNEIHFLPKDFVSKLLLARAIVKNPRLFLLDEPTAFMTFEQKQPVLKYLDRLKNTTLLIASIDPEVQRTADRILKFEQGSLVFDGNYDTFSKR